MYEIGQVLGLVRHVYAAKKPYVRDKALNIPNKERVGEQLRPDPYIKRRKNNNKKKGALL